MHERELDAEDRRTGCPSGFIVASSSIGRRDRPRAGFAIAPILYLLGLVGVGAAVLFSGYSQILRTNQNITNNLQTKNDLNGNATTMAATSVLSADTTLLCPPTAGAPSANCVASSTKLAAISGQAQLPANTAGVAGSGGSAPKETGVFTAGAGMTQLDAWGHYYIVCRWENPTSPGSGPAFMIISGGPDGNLQTKCTDTTAKGDDLIIEWPVTTAVNRSAVWQATVSGGSTTSVQFGQVGSQLVVDASGDLTVPGTLHVSGASTLAGVTVTSVSGGTGSFSSLSVSGNGTIGGTLGVTGATSLSTLSTSGLATLNSAAVTGNATVGGTLGVTGLATLNSAAVTGDATVGGTFGVTGNTTLGGTLSTAGLATLNSLAVTNNAAITGTLAAGASTLDSLTVTNNTSVGGTLTVTGVSHFTGTLNGSNAVFTGTVQAANFVGTISGGSISWGTSLVPLANGGTGYAASSTLDLLTYLGGTNASNLSSGTLPAGRIAAGEITSPMMAAPGASAAGPYYQVYVDAAGRVSSGSSVIPTPSGISDGAGDSITADATHGLTFDTNGSDVMRIDRTGKVSIGTTTAAVSLDLSKETDALGLPTGTTAQRPGSPVNGDIRYNSTPGVDVIEAYINGAWSSVITSGGGGGGLGSIYLGTSTAATNPQRSGQVSTGLFSPASGAVSVASAGTEELRINGTGVGIGTTSIANALDVNGSLAVGTYAGTATGASNELIIGGIVGIGSASPIVSLDIGQKTDAVALPSGSAAQRPGAAANGMIRYDSDSAGAVEAFINGAWETIVTTTGGTSAVNLGTSASATNPSRTGQIGTGLFSAATNTVSIATNSTEALRVDAGGNVGIGTTSPSYQLHVYQNTAATDANAAFQNAAASGSMYLRTATAGTTNNSQFVAQNASQIWGIGTVGSSNFGLFDWTNSKQPITVQNNTPTNTLYLNSTGNVGIVTSSPGAKLDIGSAGATLGTMRLEGNTSGYVQIQPLAAAGSWTLTLPNSAGTANYVLQTDGSGNTSWVNLGGSGTALNLGTSATATNPQRSGQAGTGLFSATTNTVSIAANGADVDDFTTTGENLLGTISQGSYSIGYQINSNNAVWEDSNFNLAVGNTAFPTTVSQTGGGTIGQSNTAVGYQALNANITGQKNVAIGAQALAANTTGTKNVAIGFQALTANTSGVQNMALGNGTLVANTIGTKNTGVGAAALGANTTGSNNTAIGAQALSNATTAGDNTAIGVSVMLGTNAAPNTGQFNTGVGSNALVVLQGAGANNTALGYKSGFAVTTGTDNTLVGYEAGLGVTGNSNIIIGEDPSSAITSGGSNILIGNSLSYGLTNSSSNQINIGNTIFGNLKAAAGGTALTIGTAADSGAIMTFAGVGAITLPNGSTAQRPGSAANGMVRYNSDSSGAMEAYINGAWESLVTGTGTTSTVNLGTAASATNPQRSGQAGTGLFSATTNTVSVAAGGTDIMDVTANGVSITSGTTTGTGTSSGLSMIANSLTTGTGLNVSSTSLTSGKLVNIAPTFAGAGVTGYGLYLSGTDATSSANTDYGYYGILNLNTGNAAKTAYGAYSEIDTTSTTAQTRYGLYGNVTPNYGVSVTGAETAVGIYGYAAIDSTYASATTHTIYGGQFRADQSVFNGTDITNGTLNIAAVNGSVQLGGGSSADTGSTINTYGLYISTLSGARKTSTGVSNVYGVSIPAVASTSTNTYGMNIGAISGATGSTYGINIGANSAPATTNYGINIGAISGAGTTNYGLYVGSVSGASNNYSAIFAGGNVGIGTAAPGSPLQINSSAAVDILTLINTETGHGPIIDMDASQGAGGRNYRIMSGGSTNGAVGAGRFGIWDQTANAGRLIIDTNGNIGIGNTSPGAKLDVGLAGTTLGTMRLEGNTSGYVQIQPSAAAGSWTLTLPSSSGTANYVLQTDGSGNTSWVNLGGSGTALNLGTSATATNPQRSGQAGTGLFSATTNTVSIAAGGTDVEDISATGENLLGTITQGSYSIGYQINGNNAVWEDAATNQNLAVGMTAFPTTNNPDGSGSDGQSNTAMGYHALNANTTGYHNTALGVNALLVNTTGYHNTAVGTGALATNSIGIQNTALGKAALAANTTGTQNTAVGYAALNANITGIQNVAMGAQALMNNTTGQYNTALGGGALHANTTGTQNTAVGYAALYVNTTGQYNTAVGTNTLFAATAGNNNTVLGYKSGFAVVTGTDNTLVGYEAGLGVTGNSNIIVGEDASSAITTGSSNILIGNSLSYGLTNTSSNQINIGNTIFGKLVSAAGGTAITIGTASDDGAIMTFAGEGAITLPSGSTAQRPSAANGMIRYNSDSAGAVEAYINGAWETLVTGTGGTSTINLGTSAAATSPQRSGQAGTGLFSATTNTVSIADNGSDVMDVAVTGPNILGTIAQGSYSIGYQINGNNAVWQDATNFNLAVGKTAFPTAVSQAGGGTNGQGNIAVGQAALNANTIGSSNTAVGYQAMNANTTGYNNTAVGFETLQFNTTGLNNTALGYAALELNTTGGSNTAVGFAALANNTTGISNTATGYRTLVANTTGQGNVAAGYQALTANTAGSNNTAVGYAALITNTTGIDNVAMGYAALDANTTGVNNTALGYGALTTNTTGINNIALGFQAGYDVTTGGHNIFIGDYATTGVGITTGSNNILIGQNLQELTNTSSNQLDIGNLIFATGLASGSTMSTGNVGIGTASPNTNLEVYGTTGIRVTGNSSQSQVQLNGTYGIFTNVTGDLYIDNQAASGKLIFRDNGSSEKMRIDASGNVGIGTTGPDVKLSVQGATSSYLQDWTDGTIKVGLGMWSPTAQFGTETNHALQFLTNAAVRETIDTSGNVGIGTTSPAQTLEVNGTAKVDTGLILPLIYPPSDSTTAIQIDKANGTSNVVDIDTTNGRVGIGTATPGQALDVTGNIQASNSVIAKGGTYAGFAAGQAQLGSAILAGGAVGYTGSSQTALWSGSGMPLLLGINGSEKVRIDTSGNVGIGNTSPGALLDIGKAGTTLGTMRLEGNTSGYVQIQPTAAAGSWTMTLPSSAGTANYVLQTDGSGNTSWVNLGGSGTALNLGTSATATNPQRNGQAGTGLYSDTTNTISVAANSNGLATFSGPNNAGILNLLGSVTQGSYSRGYQIAGNNALWEDATNYNVAIGPTAFPTTVNPDGTGSDGQYNTAVGYQALNANTTGYVNTAVGANALSANTAGRQNTAVGYNVLNANTTGTFNTGVGYFALRSNTIGTKNTAMGESALQANTTGTTNTGMGEDALYNNTTGSNNTAIGYTALGSNVTGVNNTALGYLAGYDVTTGGHNVIIGDYATTGVGITTGSNNILIGQDVRPPSQTANNQLNIGNLIYATGLASGSTASTGAVGIGTTAPAGLLDISGTDTVSGPFMVFSSGSFPTWKLAFDHGFGYLDFVRTGDAYLQAVSSDNNGNAGLKFQGAGYRGSIYGDASYNIHIEPNAQYGGGNVILQSINGTGNVGIGTTGPLGNLDVANATSLGNAIVIGRGTGGNSGVGAAMYAPDQADIQFKATNSGTIAVTSDAFIASGNFVGSTIRPLTTNGNISFLDAYGGNTTLFINGSNDRVGIVTTSPGAKLDIGSAGATLGTMRLEGNTSGYTQIQPAAAAGSWTMTLPTSAGTSGYVLQTDGSGVTSWVSQGSGSTINLGTSASATNPQRNGQAGTGLFSSASATVSVASSGTEMMRVNGTGVAIGTTSVGAELTIDAAGANTTPLSIQTNGSVGNYTSTNGGILVKDAAGTELWRIVATDPDPTFTHYNTWNLFIGYQAGYNNPTDNTSAGFANTGVGYQALYNNTTGSYNVAVGIQALYDNTIGYSNIGMGWGALYTNTSGKYNVAIGHNALHNATTGNYNTAVGSVALGNNSTGVNNTALGYQAGYDVTTGGHNVIIGDYATTGVGITTGSNNILIGQNLQELTNTSSNQLDIGNLIFATGLTSGTTLSTGSVGIGTTTMSTILTINGTATATNLCVTSDRRLKKDIAPLPSDMLDVVDKLKPVTYSWKKPTDIGGEGMQTGFIAQDVETVLPHLVITQKDPEKTKTLKYNEFIPVLTKAVQELDAELRAVTASVIDGLKNFGIRIEKDVTRIAVLIVDSLTIGSRAHPAGITFYDDVTAEPYCVRMHAGQLHAVKGTCDAPHS